ncbi:MAG: hypothetical protein PHU07_06230 [Acidocella sp.]|nr:hypothetical protein [Acidocella sp.]
MAATAKALGELVYARQSGDDVYVTLPIFYPSGASVTLAISKNKDIFKVTDLGLAHHEVDLVGGDRLFSRAAKRMAEKTGVLISGDVIYSICSLDELSVTISDVATASHEMAREIIERMKAHQENDIYANLDRRLKTLFGANKVETEKTLTGFSTNEWHVSALVHLDGRAAVFDVVSNHHTSVFTCSTKFNDLKLLESSPKMIAVVRDKAAMGAYYNILAQAGNVIQDNAPDQTFRKAAA